jgi:hypothetical protein
MVPSGDGGGSAEAARAGAVDRHGVRRIQAFHQVGAAREREAHRRAQEGTIAVSILPPTVSIHLHIVSIRPLAVLIHPHTVSIHLHIVSIRPLAVLIHLHIVSIYLHTVSIHPHTVSIHPHSVSIHLHTVSIHPHTVSIHPHTMSIHPHILSSRRYYCAQQTESTDLWISKIHVSCRWVVIENKRML